MKKKIWIPILVVAVLAILFTPIPTGVYKDGGTREYMSLTYKIVDWNRLTGDTTYDETKVYFFPYNFKSIDSLWYYEEDKVEHSFIATILEINGRRIRISSDVAYALIHSGGEPCEVVVLRDGQTVTLSGVRFPIDEQTGTAVMDFYVYRAPFTVAGVLHEAFFRCVTMMREIYWSIGGMFTGEVSINDLSGPVGTTQAISEISKQGMAALTYFTVFISINLGIVNLLPIPALDGGRLLLLVIEKLRKKPIPAELEGSINLVGFALLMMLVIFVTWREVGALF